MDSDTGTFGASACVNTTPETCISEPESTPALSAAAQFDDIPLNAFHSEFNVTEEASEEGLDKETLQLSVSERVSHSNWKARVHGLNELSIMIQNSDNATFDGIADEHGLRFKDYVSDPQVSAQEAGLKCYESFLEKADSVKAERTVSCCRLLLEKCTTRPRMKTIAHHCLILLIKLNQADTVVPLLLKLSHHKTNKVSQFAVQLLLDAISKLGLSIVSLKTLVENLKIWLPHRDKNIRDFAKNIYLELQNNIDNEELTKLTKAFPESLKKQFDSFVSIKHSCKNTKAVVSAPIPASKEIPESASNEIAQSSPALNVLDEAWYSTLDNSDIKRSFNMWKYKKAFIFAYFCQFVGNNTNTGKWSDKVEVLKQLVDNLSNPALELGSMTVLVNSIKKVLRDNNALLVVAGLKTIENLAKEQKEMFAGSARQLIEILFQKFRDKNRSVLSAVHGCLDAIVRYCISFSDFTTQFRLSCLSKNQFETKECLVFFVRILELAVPNSKYSQCLTKNIELFSEAVIHCLNGNPDVRNMAYLALGKLSIQVGRETISDFLVSLPKDKLSKLEESITTLKSSKLSDNSAKKPENECPELLPAKVDRKQANSLCQETKSDTYDTSTLPTISKKLESKVWSERIEGLDELKKELFEDGKLMYVKCSQFIIRRLSEAPGFKDPIFQVSLMMMDVFRQLVILDEYFGKENAIILMEFIVAKIRDPKLKDSCSSCLSEICAALGPGFVVQNCFKMLSDHKNPKTITETLNSMGSIVIIFGMQTVSLSMFVKNILEYLEASNKSVREAAMHLLVSAYRFCPDLRNFLGEVNKHTLQRVHSEIAKIDIQETVKPQREFRGAQNAEKSLVDIPRTDVGAKFSRSFVQGLVSKSWKTRVETLERVKKIINDANNYIKPSLGQLVQPFKLCLRDSNKTVMRLALQITKLLTDSMGQSFSKFVKFFFPDLLIAIGDIDKDKRIESFECIIVVMRNVQPASLLPYFVKAMAGTDTFTFRRQVLFCANEMIPFLKDKSKNQMKVLQTFCQSLVIFCLDKNTTIRVEAENLLQILNEFGELQLDKCLDSLKPSQQSDMKVVLSRIGQNDKEKETHVPELDSTTKSVVVPHDSLKSEEVHASEANMEKENEETSNIPVLSRIEPTEDRLFVVLSKNYAQSRDFVGKEGQLIQDLGQCVHSSLLKKMFSSEKRNAIEAIKAVSDAINTFSKEILSAETLFVRWNYLKLQEETNDEALNLLGNLIQLLRNSGVIFREQEAKLLVACLLQKHSVRSSEVVHGLLRQMCSVYPSSKVFAYVNEVLSNSTFEVQVECLKQLQLLFVKWGPSICSRLCPIEYFLSTLWRIMTKSSELVLVEKTIELLAVAYQYMLDTLWNVLPEVEDCFQEKIIDAYKSSLRRVDTPQKPNPVTPSTHFGGSYHSTEVLLKSPVAIRTKESHGLSTQDSSDPSDWEMFLRFWDGSALSPALNKIEAATASLTNDPCLLMKRGASELVLLVMRHIATGRSKGWWASGPPQMSHLLALLRAVCLYPALLCDLERKPLQQAISELLPVVLSLEVSQSELRKDAVRILESVIRNVDALKFGTSLMCLLKEELRNSQAAIVHALCRMLERCNRELDNLFDQPSSEIVPIMMEIETIFVENYSQENDSMVAQTSEVAELIIRNIIRQRKEKTFCDFDALESPPLYIWQLIKDIPIGGATLKEATWIKKNTEENKLPDTTVLDDTKEAIYPELQLEKKSLKDSTSQNVGALMNSNDKLPETRIPAFSAQPVSKLHYVPLESRKVEMLPDKENTSHNIPANVAVQTLKQRLQLLQQKSVERTKSEIDEHLSAVPPPKVKKLSTEELKAKIAAFKQQLKGQ